MSNNDSPESNDGDSETLSTDSRHWLTNDGLAYLLNLSLISLLAVSVLGYQVDTSGMLMTVYASSVALANIWAFGSKAASKVGDMLTGPG